MKAKTKVFSFKSSLIILLIILGAAMFYLSKAPVHQPQLIHKEVKLKQ